MQHAPRRVVAAVALVGLAATAVALVPTSVGAVDTDIAIDTSTVDFGSVDIGNTGGPISVTLTNTGGSPFGPINIFGGAPPSPAFNASQNCQGTTLPAGGSCTVNYTFSPTAAGPATDTSAFTISQTSSQSDGEDFSVTLVGVGVDTTTTTSSSTTTSSTSTTTTTHGHDDADDQWVHHGAGDDAPPRRLRRRPPRAPPRARRRRCRASRSPGSCSRPVRRWW